MDILIGEQTAFLYFDDHNAETKKFLANDAKFFVCVCVITSQIRKIFSFWCENLF